MKMTEIIKELQCYVDRDGDMELMILSYGEYVPFDIDMHIRWPIAYDKKECYIDPDN